MKNDRDLLLWYEEQNPRCELFGLFWREQPDLLRSLWPGRLFPEADSYLSTETHHLWHPGNRPDLLSTGIIHHGDTEISRTTGIFSRCVATSFQEEKTDCQISD